MREGITKIRWRLIMGVISLVAAVAASLPAAASKVDLGQRLAEIWPNDLSALAGSNLMEVIWPNAPVLGGGLDSSEDSQGDQN